MGEWTGVTKPATAAVAPITLAELPQVADMLRRVGHELGNNLAGVDDTAAAGFVGSAVPGWGLLLGARVADRLVGYVRLDRCPPPPAPLGILSLHVLAPYRRRGLGERLLRAALEAAPNGRRVEEVQVMLAAHTIANLRPWPRIAPVEQVWLSVDPSNTPALRLYEKLDFVYRPHPPVDWPVPAEFLTMVRGI